MAKLKRPPKFIQLLSTEGFGLHALAADGTVWVYLGASYGWKMLNMEVVYGSY